MTVLAIILGISAVYIPFFAWIGGMIASILVIFVASVGSNKLTTQKLILIGVALSSFLGAIQSILLLGTEDSRIQIALQWLIGSLNAVNWEVIKPAGLMILTSIIASKFMLKKLDLLNLDEPTAINFGLNLSRSRLLVGIVATCLSSCAVSIGGLIGFVGLISPHTARLLIGSNQPSKIIPASSILGAIFLSVADTISRSYTEELPVGAITALIGSPLFVFLLIHQSKKSVIN
jgi:iron complex transport system permease protein